MASARPQLDQAKLNLWHIFAQIDLYERATMLFIIVALIVLPLIGRWLSEHDDEEVDGRAIGLFLTGLTAVGVLTVIAAVAMGPHPV